VAPVQADKLDKHTAINYKAQITKIEDVKESTIDIIFGITKVALYDKRDDLIAIDFLITPPEQYVYIKKNQSITFGKILKNDVTD